MGANEVDKVSYLGLPNCYKMTNGVVESVVTTDTGPRVIRYAVTGADNVLAELPDVTVTTALGDWKPLGGHRLWTAPEAKPRSYVPDSQPVAFVVEGERSIRLTAPIDPRVGIEKELLVTLDRTIGSTNLLQLSAQVGPVVQQARSGGKEIVDYAFWKGIYWW